MRILHCLAQLPMKTGSGVYFDTVLRYMDERSHENAALYGVQAPFDPDLPCTETFPVVFNSDVLPFPIAGMSDEMPYDSTVFGAMSDEDLQLYIKVFRKRLEEAKRIFKPQVVISHHIFLMTAIVREVFSDIPVVGISHGTDLRQVRKHERFLSFLEGAKHLDAYWALGENDKNCLTDLFGLKRERIEVTGGGFKDTIFYAEKADEAKKERRRQLSPQVVYAGKISRSKGIFEFIQAFVKAQVEFQRRHNSPPAELIYIGNGTDEQIEELKRLSGYNERIRFLPAMAQPDLAALLRQADFYTLPSYYEGIALTAVEAMACNLPVITTKIIGLMELLGPIVNESGFIEYVDLPRLYDVDKPVEEDIPAYIERLTEALLRQFEKWATGEVMPPHVRKAVESHSWHHLIAEMEARLMALIHKYKRT